MKDALSPVLMHIREMIATIIPYFKQKRIFLGSVVILTLLIISAIISLSLNQSSNILPYHQNIEVLKYQRKLYVAIDDLLLESAIQSEDYQSYARSIDGNVAVLLTNDKQLYLIKDRQVKKIADDVLHYEISSTGMGVAFAQKYMQHYTLALYDTQEDARREITDLLSKLDFSLSPDGHTLAYYTLQNDQDILMCHYKGDEVQITDIKTDLIGLANDGKYIFAVCYDANGTSTLCSFNRKGKATELGTVTSISFKFNDDHQQIMFYNNGKTLVSTDGQSAVTVSSYPLYLVTAPNSLSASDKNSITLPVSSLFGHVYTCSDGEATSAWLILKDPEDSKKLASEVSGCTLDTSGKYLYFIYKQTQLSVVNVSADNNLIRTLADNVDLYTVSSDRSRIYFTSDGELYCTSGTKTRQPKLISGNVSNLSLLIGNSDTVYFMIGNNLYRSKNGQRAKLTIENIHSIYSSPNNAVYILGENAIYSAYQQSKPCKILGSD